MSIESSRNGTTEPTRRLVLRGLAAAGALGVAGLGLAACGGDNGRGTETVPSGAGPAGAPLARTDEIPVGGGKVFSDDKVVVTQPQQGTFVAFSAVCTHQGCTVSEVTDGTINCPCHGSKFAVDDGSVKAGPATRPLPRKQTKVEGEQIIVT